MINFKNGFFSYFLIANIVYLALIINSSFAESVPASILNGQEISIIDGKWVPVRSEPNQSSEFKCPVGVTKKLCNNVKSISSSTALTLTGERIFDEDNKNWYVEATFSYNGKTFSGWFDEKQTSLDAKEALVRAQTAKRQEELWEKQSEIGLSDVSEYKLDMSSEATKLRFLETEKHRKQLLAETAMEKRRTGIAKSMFLESRGLLRMHNIRSASCGSYDYSEEGGLESYAAPITACVVTKLAETWRKEFCPKNTPCRLEFGDISHETKEKFDGHGSHTHGHCVDIRPIRNIAPENAHPSNQSVNRLTHKDDDYDQAKTAQLLKLIADMGGTSIIFNDPKLIKEDLSKRYRDHDDHIHVCFKPDNEIVQKQCASYEPDAKMCYTSEILFDHPLMREMKENLKETLENSATE